MSFLSTHVRCTEPVRPGLFLVLFPLKSVKRFARFFELARFGTRVSTFWYITQWYGEKPRFVLVEMADRAGNGSTELEIKFEGHGAE